MARAPTTTATKPANVKSMEAAVPLLDKVLTAGAKTVVPAAIGAVAALFTGWLTYLNDARELDLKMIDVALAILSGEKGRAEGDAENTDAYYLSRRFALEALAGASKITITEEARERWAQSGATPLNPFFSVIDTYTNPSSGNWGNSVSRGTWGRPVAYFTPDAFSCRNLRAILSVDPHALGDFKSVECQEPEQTAQPTDRGMEP